MNLKSAILATLTYADIFNYPLTDAEIWRYLITKQPTLNSFRLAQSGLLEEKKIRTFGNYFFLNKRQKLAGLRIRRQKIARKKFIHARNAANIIKYIPGILYIGISGALALSNAPRDDDIDFFIITAPFSLWQVRLLTTLVLDLLGWRRKPNSRKFSDKICLNMFLDAHRLSLPKSSRNLYIAHEIVQLKTLVDKNNTYTKFLTANSWVKKYLPQAVRSRQLKNNPLINHKHETDLVERFLKYLQLKYMRPKITQEKISDFILQFHPQNKEKEIKTAYCNGLKKLGIDKTPGWFIK